MPSPISVRHPHRALTAATFALLMLPAATSLAYPFGSGTCDASASANFMTSRIHHPGENGGFELVFSTPDYIAGETLAVTLRHSGSEVFTGFLVYPETAAGFRRGLFDPTLTPGTTLMGGLPSACNGDGHTITHDQVPNNPQLRGSLSLVWTAPSFAENLTFRALVLRADPMAQRGTDFYEVSAALPASVDGIFRSKFESIP